MFTRLGWQQELAIIDRTMKAISGVTDPQKLVSIYYDGIGDLVQVENYVSLSRRNETAPEFVLTRSSRFTQDFNPWTQRDRLPRLRGGLLAELLYAGQPEVIDDLPARLTPDDPAFFHLSGYQSAVALPMYDNGQALNMTVMLLQPGEKMDRSLIPMLHWQGSLMGRGTQNLVLKNQLATALAQLDKELQVVGEIQKSLLPTQLPQLNGFQLAAHYLTSARAGGDYYDFFPLDNDRWGIFIADVSGHGTPAAVLMAITHAIAHSQPGRHTPPAALLAHLNDQLTTLYTRAGTFVTAFYAVLDVTKRCFTYSSAGHNPPRLVRSGTVLSLDENGALPLGVQRGERYEEANLQLHPGDLLLLYTDGITEAMPPYQGGEVNLFGLDRLDALLLQNAHQSAQASIDQIRSAVEEFCRGIPSDDQTLIALQVVPMVPRP